MRLAQTYFGMFLMGFSRTQSAIRILLANCLLDQLLLSKLQTFLQHVPALLVSGVQISPHENPSKSHLGECSANMQSSSAALLLLFGGLSQYIGIFSSYLQVGLFVPSLNKQHSNMQRFV